MKTFIIAAALFASADAFAAQPQEPDPNALAAARRMLVATQFADRLKADRPYPVQIDAEVLADCARDHVAAAVCDLRMTNARGVLAATEAARERMMPQVVEAAAAAYATHLSASDLDRITAFYTSETGRKLVAELPAISREVREAQQRLLLTGLATSISAGKTP